MTTISFYAAYNMASAQVWSGNVTGATSSMLTLTNGFNTANYLGSFNYQGSNVLGTLRGLNQFAGNSLQVAASGASVDASLAASYINSNQIQSFFQLTLAGSDTLYGSPYADVLFGYDGNDTIYGGGGNDTIDGGTGVNIAGYSGSISRYRLTLGASSVTLADSSGTDGTDTLINIQQLAFTDTTLTLPTSNVLTASLAASLSRLASVSASGPALSVSDTAANISANLDALNRLTGLSRISASDGLAILINATQAASDSAALGKISGKYLQAATIVGVGGVQQSLGFDDRNNLAIAQSLLDGVGAGTVAQAGNPTAVPSGRKGLLQVNSAGQYAIGAGYSALVNTAPTNATIFGGASNGQLVVSGDGGLSFSAGTGAGTVIAGGGRNLISTNTNAGDQTILTGGGDDTVLILAGNNTISTGAGTNMIYADVTSGRNVINSTGNDLIQARFGQVTVNAGSNNPTIYLGLEASEFNGGSGNATVVVGVGGATLNARGHSQLWLQTGGGVVNSTGADTIIGGAGAATVNALTGNDFVFAGVGGLRFNGGSGVSTVLGNFAGSASLVGGTGSLIDIGYGSTNFVGGSGADTIAAFSGSATIAGGSGTGVYLGGPGGHNHISGGSGRATILGGGDGDVLTAGSGPGDVIKAGGGAETISALGTTGTETFYAGPGNDLFLLGGGPTQLLTSTGNATIVAGTGTELFAFTAGNHPGVLIQNFVGGHDFISLVGFGAGAVATALGAATVVSGSEHLVLSDGTQITFQNVTGLTGANFL